MTRLLFISALIAAASAAPMLQAAAPHRASRGVTGDGRVMTAPLGVAPPWGADIIRLVNPRYPTSLRAKHPVATGFFRVVLDVRTGGVRQVVVEQSSGYSAIDASIIAALQQWKLRPNRWREFEVHVTLRYDEPR